MFDSLIAWVYRALRWEKCDECNRPAGWVRHTQFAGEHYFCDRHARQQADFGKEDPSYYVWERIV